jgi:hypothetical protein
LIQLVQKRQDEKANLMYDYYNQGYSLEQVVKAFGITRQSVFKMFKKRNFKLRDKPKPLSFVIFNGFKYTLRNNGYYGRTNGDRTLLHRDIWEFYNGSIPPGYDVHHKDEERNNNQLKNFELLPKSEHTRLYSPHNNQYTKGQKLKRADG